MSLSKVKGLHRASLCLAIGYYNPSTPGSFDRTVKVVATYLKNNGLNFDYNVLANKMIVKKTVELAEDVINNKIELERAMVLLEDSLF